MTRFARAKGSKASNERAPEDSTPWSVMKEQLDKSVKEREEAKNREKVEKKRMENYQNFLNEQKISKRKTTWCDFPETESKKHKIIETENNEKKKSNKKEKHDLVKQDILIEDSLKNQVEKRKKKKKQKKVVVSDTSGKNTKIDDVMQSGSNSNEEKDVQKEKKSKKKGKYVQNDHSDSRVNYEQQSNSKKINNNSDKKFQPMDNKKKNKFERNKKHKEGNKFDDRAFHLIINGKEIELVKFDGFPIIKKDAERLAELRKNMFAKGIPKSEVDRNIKLERRRAEKVLARVKKEVCYNCRKGGHNLSDCPELKSKIPEEGSGADGICFKCGSTEHRQFECRVQKGNDYKFASCFICNEQGHIARQCPDNPRGLYPNGGGCRLCGDVTHMKKDCPTVNKEKELPAARLPTLADEAGLEDVDTGGNQTLITDPKTKQPKHVKF